MPTYKELLESREWKSRRNEILTRDNFVCETCNNKKIIKNYYLGAGTTDFYNNRLSIRCQDKIFPIPFGHSEYLNDLLRKFPEKTTVYFKGDNIYYNQTQTRGISILGFREYNEKLVKACSIRHKLNLALKYGVNILIDESLKNAINAKTDDEAVQILTQPYDKIVALLENETAKWYTIFGLNVHHLYYQDELLPWEYPDKALITYCKECHQELHEEIRVPHKDKNGKDIGFLISCPRCGGAGELPQYWYVENGICFQCRGAQYVELTEHENH